GGGSTSSGTAAGGGAGSSYAAVATYTAAVATSQAAEVVISYSLQQATSTALVVSPAGGSTYGQSVTFTATVSPVPGGTGTPAGTVTFLDGSTALGTASLNAAGGAAYTTNSLSPGSHTVTAVYGGEPAFTGSASAALVYTVSRVPTTIVAQPVLATLPNLVATLTTGSGQALAGETITFTTTNLLGQKAIVCQAVTGPTGAATCTGGVLGQLFNLGLSYTATFAGDADYLGSSAQGALL
ncbi:Ig-like domain repeat protein, partial [Actinospica durhamensis]